MEVTDATDHRRSRDEMVTIHEQTFHQTLVANVGFDESKLWMVVMHTVNAPVLGEVVDADHLITTLEQLAHDVAADEP